MIILKLVIIPSNFLTENNYLNINKKSNKIHNKLSNLPPKKFINSFLISINTLSNPQI